MGGLWGSFANVCIYRLPKKQDVVSGRSYCPKCKKKIVWYDNIPIISYFLLGGKCRKCKKKILPKVDPPKTDKLSKTAYNKALSSQTKELETKITKAVKDLEEAMHLEKL